MKLAIPALLCVLLLGSTPGSIPVTAADNVYDTDADQTLDAFDAVRCKRDLLDSTSDQSVKPLLRYLVCDGTLSDSGMWMLEEKGTIHTGEATYYGGGYEGGCCMLDPVSTVYYVAAMNYFDYDNALLAGAYVEATGPTGTVQLLITDLLPEGKVGDLDLNIDAFPMIARLIDGRAPVSWKIIPFPTEDPVTYQYKEGSSAFWCGVQVRNHRYPVATLEYLDADGEFVALERKHYNYFVSSELGAGPFTFRVTDIYGDSFIDTDIPLVPEGSAQGTGQFPE